MPYQLQFLWKVWHIRTLRAIVNALPLFSCWFRLLQWWWSLSTCSILSTKIEPSWTNQKCRINMATYLIIWGQTQYGGQHSTKFSFCEELCSCWSWCSSMISSGFNWLWTCQSPWFTRCTFLTSNLTKVESTTDSFSATRSATSSWSTLWSGCLSRKNSIYQK